MGPEDINYMNRAIELADRGKGWVNPNPLVGAVLSEMAGLSGKDGMNVAENFMQNGMPLNIAGKIRRELRYM